jgi:hypothetical protein
MRSDQGGIRSNAWSSPCESARGLPQSKTWRTLAAAFAFALLSAVTSHAQSYSIDWSKISGGGGTSTGGVYSVSGTIGQPDAGVMTGANFAITGGFWSLIAAVPTPGAPRLSVTLTATNTVLISWPSPSTGFQLQQNPNLATGNWVTTAQTPADNGVIKTIVISPPTGSSFYRLRK